MLHFLAALLLLHCAVLFASPSPRAEEYEYVVVGSGPGGGPLAARLALAGRRVLLLEAGDDHGDSLYEQVPAYNFGSSEWPEMQWNYYVEHWDNAIQQERDSKLVWKAPDGSTYVGTNPPTGSSKLGVWYPRAGTLGGCGQHNALISLYPFNSDWNDIAMLTGDASWNSGNMRKYFERLEDIQYIPPSLKGHGTNGWLGTTLPSLPLIAADSQLLSLITSAARAIGTRLQSVVSGVEQLRAVFYPDINSDDLGRDQRQALYEFPNAVTDAKRSGPRGFVMSVAEATNSDGTRKYHLDIRLNCLVTKVLFNETSDSKPKAMGVEFLDGKSLYSADPRSNSSDTGVDGSAYASKEVIISAGAYNTPQLLKLSGIGPREELAAFDIPVVLDSPGVGTNLQDRYEVSVIAETTKEFEISKDCTSGDSDPCLDQWKSGDGPYANNGIYIAMTKKSGSAKPDDTVDTIFGGVPFYFRGYYPGYSADAGGSNKNFTWYILKGHTRNTAGTVTLRSSSPRDTPLIEFRYFNDGTLTDGADKLDLNAVVEGVFLAREMLKNTTAVDGNAGFKEVWPGPNVSTWAEVSDWVKDEAWGHHASCTCPIGADGDAMAVLDSSFRVRGVEGLRVVDASVFPKIPGFFIAVPTYMISEKAADIILSSS